MKLQGTLGYLHEVDRELSNNYVIAYAIEGSQIKYYYLETKEEAERLIQHWGKTGDLLVDSYNFISGKLRKDVINPTMVRLLECESTYKRKMYPKDME